MSSLDPRENRPLFLFRAGSVSFLLLLVTAGAVYLESAQFQEWDLRAVAASILLGMYLLGHVLAFAMLYSDRRERQRQVLWLLGAVLVCLFFTAANVQMTGTLAAFWIARTPDTYPLRVCTWLLAGTLALCVAAFLWRGEATEDVLWIVLYAPVFFFVLSISYSATREKQLRRQTIALHGELKAAQARLADSAKQKERLRIAREMHDLLGHHMTALILNLEVAGHKASGEARGHVEQSLALAKLLLSDLRTAVSDLREYESENFRAALDGLIGKVPELAVECSIEEGLELEDGRLAETLLRCIQEALTNTLRHAGADLCRIRLYRRDKQIVLEISDNGSVKSGFTPGNGLKGMQERIAALAGSLQWRQQDGGFFLQARLPLGEAAP